ncbi:cell differentiation protein rcd1-like [Solanum lycopersicum]|uniref:cell differentiation protein rcd1-like n=1 Tax=Solanum lycopersicum TaxID=4081 RepID=UPI000532B4E9|nr:cell differentiation protein rcd1-like [Solanum lycopersicum]
MENLPESLFSESTLISSLSRCNISSSHVDMQQNSHDLDGLTPNQLVVLLLDSNLRGDVMYQLIKMRDTCEYLAPLLWNTFNAVYMLLLEVISVYWKLSPPTLSMKESTRVCNALALFQVMAKNPETRKELIEAKIPCYFYPFLKPSGDDKPLEYLRLTSLGVLGALAKFDDPYGPKVLHFFLETKVVPSCLECMDLCDELSGKVATLIVMKILMQEKGMSYCCATPERFFSIVQVLYRVVEKLTEKPCLLHLMYVIQCLLSLSEIQKVIGPSEAFIRQVHPKLFDNTFKDILRDDHETAWMLQVLHFNVYGRLSPPE